MKHAYGTAAAAMAAMLAFAAPGVSAAAQGTSCAKPWTASRSPS